MDRNRVMKEIVDWLVHIVTAIVITIIIIRFVGQFTIVQGNSCTQPCRTRYPHH